MLRCLSTMVLSFCFIFFVNICILLYIFSLSFWGVFPHFFYCVFRHNFLGRKLLFFLPFPKFLYCISGIIKFALLCWGRGGQGEGSEGGALPAFVLNNVTFKCNRKRNSLLHIPRQRIQSPIISDFIVYLCRNY